MDLFSEIAENNVGAAHSISRLFISRVIPLSRLLAHTRNKSLLRIKANTMHREKVAQAHKLISAVC